MKIQKNIRQKFEKNIDKMEFNKKNYKNVIK